MVEGCRTTGRQGETALRIITPGVGETFDIELEENLLAKNRELAQANRRRHRGSDQED